jgi:hypothetical protein
VLTFLAFCFLSVGCSLRPGLKRVRENTLGYSSKQSCPTAEGMFCRLRVRSCAGSLPLQAAYSSELLYIITLWLTKCSVSLLLLRISPQKEHQWTSYGILGSSTLFMFISTFIVAFRCNVAEPWVLIDAHCVNLVRQLCCRPECC